MRNIVRQTIQRHRLIKPDALVLVGVSGGGDSVALLYALHALQDELHFALAVAHLNHQIRGAEAEQDEHFVQQLCWRLRIPFFSERADVPAKARADSVSLEMAARQVRFDFFMRTAQCIHADCLALAHNTDDHAETVMLRLCRGTGPQGLGGLPYTNILRGLAIIRPLRDVSHMQAIHFLQSHALNWREDHSNTDTRFLRNRVRHEILPLLETRMNPRIRQALGRMADIVRDENEWIHEQTQALCRACQSTRNPMQLNLNPLKKTHVALHRRVLQMWLYEQLPVAFALTMSHFNMLDQVINDMQGTQMVQLGQGWRVVRRYDQLFLEQQTFSPSFNLPLQVPGETLLPMIPLRVTTSWQQKLIKDPGRKIADYPCFVCISADRLADQTLYMRSWKAGDSFQPLGMKGTRKIQDIFVDAKIPRDQRQAIPLLICEEEIVWIPGYQVARGWEVPGKNSRALLVSVE